VDKLRIPCNVRVFCSYLLWTERKTLWTDEEELVFGYPESQAGQASAARFQTEMSGLLKTCIFCPPGMRE